ncbi:FAD dependent oxidoreductase-domain-containing protein [Paraphysoderma sedebokerense]|nr:FAD dependent oxidoreductase-domain-containing protein [Paraphysoderma sedebokerense]
MKPRTIEKPVPLIPVQNPTRSYWIADNTQYEKYRSTPDLPTESPVVIIGGGMTGVSLLYHLSQMIPGTTVLLLEARGICSGATGRNGGHAIPHSFHGFFKVAKSLGDSKARSLVSFETKCVTEILDTIKFLNSEDEVGVRQGGFVVPCETDEEFQKLLKDVEEYERVLTNDLEKEIIEIWDSEKTKEKLGTDKFCGAAYSSYGFQFWPFKFVIKLLERSIRRTNVNVQTQTIVEKILLDESPMASHKYVVHTNRGQNHIIPVRGQMMASSTEKFLWPYSISANDDMEYWHQRYDRTIILGGGREFARPDMEIGVFDDSIVNPKVSLGLQRLLREIAGSDSETGTRSLTEWTGIMGFADRRLPYVGRLNNKAGSPSGQYVAVGYTGHGMPRAFLAAKNLVYLHLNRTDKLHPAVKDIFTVPPTVVEQCGDHLNLGTTLKRLSKCQAENNEFNGTICKQDDGSGKRTEKRVGWRGRLFGCFKFGKL